MGSPDRLVCSSATGLRLSMEGGDGFAPAGAIQLGYDNAVIGEFRRVAMTRVWRVVLLPTFAICVMLLAACGGGGNDPVTRPQALAFARTVNIRRADVPGMAVFVASFETNNGPPYSSCTTRVGPQGQVGAVESPWLLRSKRRLPSPVRFTTPVPPVEGVHSVVYVMREPVIASRNVASGRRAMAPACVARLRAKEASGRFIGHEPYKLGISALSIPFPLAGVAGYGLRVQGTIAAVFYRLKRRPTYYEDTFGFVVGSTEIVLSCVGVERPFPSAKERRLLDLLYSRVKAHTLNRPGDLGG